MFRIRYCLPLFDGYFLSCGNSINYEFGASSLPSCLFGDNPYIIAKNTQERMAPKNAAPIKLRNNSREARNVSHNFFLDIISAAMMGEATMMAICPHLMEILAASFGKITPDTAPMEHPKRNASKRKIK